MLEETFQYMKCFYFRFDVEVYFQVHKTILLLLYTADFPRVIWKVQYLFVICPTVEKFEEKNNYKNYILYWYNIIRVNTYTLLLYIFTIPTYSNNISCLSWMRANRVTNKTANCELAIL